MSAQNIFTIHPALAEAIPMMTDNKLEELTADIAAHGQRLPIMLDHEGKVLIDGRCRLEACWRAGVEPVFARLPAGEDPVAYIVSANLMYQYSTKGQRAMRQAMIREMKGEETAPSNVLEGNAFTVLRSTRSLAELVVKGIMPLNEALAKVRQEEQLLRSDGEKLKRLRRAAPDLAAQVIDERLKLDAAIATLDTRQQEHHEVCKRGRRAAEKIVDNFVVQVQAIIAACKAGEHIVIEPDLLGQLGDAYSKLLAELNKEV
jgi:hypothetical protein